MAERIPIKEGLFMEQGGQGMLLANKCQSCGQIFFPKAIFCLNCSNKDMAELKLSRRGKLYAYTIGRMDSMYFKAPYAIGYIDMPEGVRVFAPLKMMQDKPLKIGMEMELAIENLWQEDGKEIIGYRFKPV